MRVRRTGVKIIAIFSTVALVNLIWSSQAAFADSNISVSLSTNQVNLDLTADNFNSSTQTINVSSTSTVGYIINFAASGANTSLVNENDNTKTIPTITLPSGSDSIPVSAISRGYGYSIDGGANYFPAPSNSDSAQIFETFTAGTNSHTLTYGAKASNADVAGAYDNTFIIYAISKLEPCPIGNICYYGNGRGNDVTGTMSNQPATSNQDVILIASNFSRPGYGFAGWNTAPDGTGTNYGPNQTINPGDLSTLGLQLYARWIPSAGNLQNWKGCNNLSSNEITALTDTRDGNTYAVAKYADDQCWTMENFRLDLSDPNLEISNINTNHPTSTFANTVNRHNTTEDHIESTNSFCAEHNEACLNKILFNTNNTNRSLTASYDANDTTSSWYSYGNYYNWYTITAGNGTRSVVGDGVIAEGDLCPAGWRLPTGHSISSDLSVLDIRMGGSGNNTNFGDDLGKAASKRWRSYPYNFIEGGEYKGDATANRAISSSYATSSAAGRQQNERTDNLWLKSDGVHMNNNVTYKNRGQTMRCIINEEYAEIGNVHYDSNGGTGSMADATNVDFGSAVAANNEFTKAYNLFDHWNTSADGTGVSVLEGSSIATAASRMGLTDGDTLTLYAIWRPNNIVYDSNGASVGTTNFPHPDFSQPVTLYSPNLLRSGYGFAGWSPDPNAATKIINNQQVIIYGPNETISPSETLSSYVDSSGKLTLYATWLPADANRTLQTFGSADCGALSIGDILALTDSRNNETYAVAKLGDGHCWMLENLRLDPSTTSFSSTNTNSPNSTFVSNASLSGSSDVLCGNNDSACIDQIAFNANNLDSSLRPSPVNISNGYWYSYGVMYNWYTATAGNGNFAMTSGNTTGDICPAGWRLPTGGSGGEFESLNTIINGGSLNASTGLRAYPNNLVFSGDYNQTGPGGRATYSRLWSSTPSSDTDAYRFGFFLSDVTPIKAYSKWDAFAVRCIVKNNT